MIAEEYKDIAPYEDEEFARNMERLVSDPGFENAIGYVLPGTDFGQLVNQLRRITNKNDFQKQIMISILRRLEDGTTAGVTDSGMENIDASQSRLFISNHRDIVLDASFLGLVMIRRGLPAQEVALGDNLLIYDWIEHLVRLNKGIIVKRNLRLTKECPARGTRQRFQRRHPGVRSQDAGSWRKRRQHRRPTDGAEHHSSGYFL